MIGKWFPDKRGLAIGLALVGYGGGSAVFGPIANLWMIPHLGWRATFAMFGLYFLAMTMTGALLLRNPPAAALRFQLHDLAVQPLNSVT